MFVLFLPKTFVFPILGQEAPLEPRGLPKTGFGTFFVSYLWFFLLPKLPVLQTWRAFPPANYLVWGGIFQAMYRKFESLQKKWRAFPPVNYLHSAGILEAMYKEL